MRFLLSVFLLMSLAPWSFADYEKAQANAIRDGLPLVVFVNAEVRPIPGSWCCRVDKMTGFPETCVVVAAPDGDKLFHFATYEAGDVVRLPAADQSSEALDEVNAQRAAAGLRPYIHDPALTAGAKAVAAYRAANRISGHVSGGMGDFGFLPPGVSASCGGCAVRSPGEPFAACAIFDNYSYCGAATVIGQDGQKYCHLFCR